jgi:hypothetical protein
MNQNTFCSKCHRIPSQCCCAPAKTPTLVLDGNRVYPTVKTLTDDPVNHPKHYTEHPSGVECIQITEHMGFNLGNALKYIWRCDLKKDAVEDLCKARWYIDREIAKRTK